MAGNGFFDMREKLAAPRRRATPAPAGGEQTLSVSQLTRLIDGAIRAHLPHAVDVRGEVSNFKFHRGSGHAYFTLKDPQACIDCVMFKSDFASVKFQPTDGLELLARGEVKVYAPQGRHQLYVSKLQPLGRGALELALQQLREKLSAEGLFDPQRKRPIPRYPRQIALITSRDGAALQDMLKVLRRVPCLSLLLYHVPVQGDGCGRTIAAALQHLCRHADRLGGIDLILLGRGGGSLEDLWGFNDETLARAIAASPLPIITGIGHEVDVSIADLVADHWAHTPTEAAACAIAHWRNVDELLNAMAVRLSRQMRNILADRWHRLRSIERHELFRRPTHQLDRLAMRLDDRERALQLAMHRRLQAAHRRLATAQQRLDRHSPATQLPLAQLRVQQIDQRLQRAMRNDMHRRQSSLDALSARLESLNPHRVLQRGYSITTVKKTRAIVRAASQLKPGQAIISTFADGQAESVVEDASQPKLFE